ncbi:PAS domain-containing protein [Pontiellaceae bacterium B12227]|nr:PAS domain-containing protein [Pontiellaceae bacterium B12227]
MSDNIQQALNELRLTMGKMEVGLGLIDDAIVWINEEGDVEWCNGGFDRLVKRSHIENIGQSFAELLPLEELGTEIPEANHPAVRVLAQREMQRGYYQLVADNIPIELIAQPLFLPDESGGAIFTLRDISKLQELEQIRLQSLALQAAADAMVITDADGCIEWVNRAYTALTGYTAEESYGRKMEILQSGKTDQQVYREMWSTIAAGEVWNGELINKTRDGHTYFEEQSITPVRDRVGVITHHIAIKRDISSRKLAEKEIRKLSSVVTRTDNSVIITNEAGEIEWVNRAFILMTEFTLEEVIGRKPGSFLQGPETDQDTVREMSDSLKIHNGFNVEIINYSKSGKKYWLSIEVRPLYDDHGQTINFLAIENNITERKQAEEELASARRREIDIASRIQRTLLLGRSSERIKGVQVAAMSVPSQDVDGDFFDCFVHNQQCMDIVIGDVMGKGVPAALLGGAAKNAILRAMCSIMSSSADHHLPLPREIMMSLHAGLVRELIDLNSFVTLIYARICSDKGTLSLVDCGHTRSIHCGVTDESCHFFSGNNSPLGFAERETYEESVIRLAPCDVVVFYSDGITEAADASGNMFGEERLLEVVCENRHLNCDAILEQIHQAVCTFSTHENFGDDLTCLVIKMDERIDTVQLDSAVFEYPVDLSSLSILREDLNRFFSTHYPVGQLGDTLSQLLTGVNEACSNIIQHAFEKPSPDSGLEMKLIARPKELQMELCHNGAAFTGISSVLPSSEGYSESGFGLYIMEQNLDSIHYARREDGWNRVVLTKDINLQEIPPNES